MSTIAENAKAIFLEAVEKHPTGPWKAFLDERCGANQQIRQRVEGLLLAHQDHDQLFDHPDPTAEYCPHERPGQVIGPYKLRECLGEGGMGVVWAAEQKLPLRRKVALKLIKPGMDSQQVIARFEAEREALSLMDHPNIARVLDAGTTDQGRPFFVMELICGVSITEYCDAKRLTLEERLGLFAQVCRAVQHAHQKGIIHRDVKPSNVLVTQHDDQPVPKVIDFGVAKALRQPLTEYSIYTGLFQAIGTLAYMSPEQAQLSGLNVDTRADIYGLGVLLYELLTGETPFDKDELASVALDEACRIIREQEPPRPSTKFIGLGSRSTAISELRKTTASELEISIRRDLDWIIMKALEKDRSRRYESAGAFAADLERFQRNEPIEARPPSVSYRCGKFIRRNRTMVAGTTLAILALLLGTLGTTVALVKERAASRHLQQVLSAYCEELRQRAREVALTGNFEETEQAIARAQNVRESEAWENVLWGQFYLYRGDTDRAIGLLEQAMDQEPKNVPAAALLCEAQVMAGRLEPYLDTRLHLKSIEARTPEETILKALAWRFGPHEPSALRELIEKMDALPNWRTSPWARKLRSELLMWRALTANDPALAEEAVKEAMISHELLPESVVCVAQCLATRTTCFAIYQMMEDEENAERHKTEGLELIEKTTFDRGDFGQLAYCQASFFEAIGDTQRAGDCWKAYWQTRPAGWTMLPAIVFFQRNHDFDMALEIWENAESSPFGKVLSAPILLEFPQRRSDTLAFLRKSLTEVDERFRQFVIPVMCLFGDSETARQASRDLLPSITEHGRSMLKFFADDLNEDQYLAEVERENHNRGDAHLVIGMRFLGQLQHEQATRHFSAVLESEDATLPAKGLAETFLSRMQEDASWPHLSIR